MIKISNEVKAYLDKMKRFDGESYSEVILGLIEDSLEINEETKRALDNTIKPIKLEKTISHQGVKKSLGF